VVRVSVMPAGEVQVWSIDLDQTAGDLALLLSVDEADRAEEYTHTRDRNRFILARGAMRSILGQQLGISGAAIRFEQGEHGKPYISELDSVIEFNLTHCQGHGLLAVSGDCAVGIDLERIRPGRSQLKIAQRLFPQSIVDELSALPADQVDAAFYHHWTKFEACTKYHGAGIFHAENTIEELSATHFAPRPGWIACVATCKPAAGDTLLKHFSFIP